MGKCKHEIRMRAVRVVFAPGVESPYIDRNRRTGALIRDVLVDACRCVDCGAWLSLGTSKDDGEFAEAIAIELRAAEIAVPYPHSRTGRFTDDRQYIGLWRHPEVDDGWGREEWTGYLAAEIAAHRDPT